MATTLKRLLFPRDANKHPIPIFPLTSSQNVDGTSASAQSGAINGTIVRIVAKDADITVAVGSNPTALATSIAITQGSELWLPIEVNWKVAVLGGIANVCIAGK